MRSDHLKQHSKTHPYLWQLHMEECKTEPLTRKMAEDEKENKIERMKKNGLRRC